MHEPKEFTNEKLVPVVALYATPLAVILVLLGAFLAEVPPAGRTLCLVLLGISVFFNFILPLARGRTTESRQWILTAKVYFNMAINVVFVYVLGETFRPIWILMALTPIATAIYGSRETALLKAAAASIFLLAIEAVRPDSLWRDWGEQSAHVAFIFLITMMISEVVSLVYREK